MDIFLLLRFFDWILFSLYGQLIWVGDMFLTNIAKIFGNIIDLIVNNEVVTTVYNNMVKIQWLLLPLGLVALGYMCWIYINEKEVGHHIKRIVITMSLVCMIPTFIGWGKEFVSFTPQLASDILGSNGNTMGLANALFSVNPDFEKCVESNPSGKNKAEPPGVPGDVWDMSASGEERFLVGNWFIHFDIMGKNINIFLDGKERQDVIDFFKDEGYDSRADPSIKTMLGEDELDSLSPTGYVVENRYMHTACTTANDKRIVTMHYKWQLPNFIMGILLSLLIFLAAIMAFAKICDAVIEFMIGTVLLPLTVSANMYEGMSNIWWNTFKSWCRSAITPFLTIVSIVLVIVIGSVMINNMASVINNVFSSQISFIKYILIMMAQIGVAFCMYQLIIAGPDIFNKAFGVDTGARSSAAAMAIGAGFGSAVGAAAGWAGGKAKNGINNLRDRAGKPIADNKFDAPYDTSMPEDDITQGGSVANGSTPEGAMSENDITQGASGEAGMEMGADQFMSESDITSGGMDNDAYMPMDAEVAMSENDITKQDEQLTPTGGGNRNEAYDDFMNDKVKPDAVIKATNKAKKNWDKMSTKEKSKYLTQDQINNGDTSWDNLDDHTKKKLSSITYGGSWSGVMRHDKHKKSNLDIANE